jgi:hypothetical protein
MARIHFADLGTVETAIASWSQEQILCRSNNNHWWERQTVWHDVRQGYIYEMQGCAQGCGCTRYRYLSEYLRPLSKWTGGYPNGYLLPKGSGRMDEDGRAAVLSAAMPRRIPQVRARDSAPPKSKAARAELARS